MKRNKLINPKISYIQSGIIVFLFIFLIQLSSCSNNKNQISFLPSDLPEPSEITFIPELIEDGIVADNEFLELIFVSESNAIQIHDKRNGKLWNSIYDPESITDTNINRTWKQNMMSMFSMSYSETSESGRDQVVSASFENLNPSIEVQQILNGIRIRYTFNQFQMSLLVDFILDDISLLVKIPIEGIKENGNTFLVRLDVLPFFGSVINGEEGYIFYPDGNGAIMNFDRPNIGRRPSPFSMSIYSTQEFNFQKNEIGEIEDAMLSSSSAMLPVFGLKHESSGFLAILSNGEEDASINLYPGGVGVPVNRISSSFTYRRTYNIYSAYDTSAGRPQGRPLFMKIDRDIISTDKEIQYIFLTENEANYSGMANAYRKYLIDKGILEKKIKYEDDVPLSIEVFMGTLEPRFLKDRFIKTTTFNQVSNIIEQLKAYDTNMVYISLKGWNEQGYGAYPQSLSHARELGGKREIDKLVELTDLYGWKLSLQINPVDIIKNNGDFSVRNDIVYNGDGFPLQDDSGNRYVFNPVKGASRIYKDFNLILDRGISGVQFNRIGSQVYDDFNRNNQIMRFQTVDVWEQLLAASNESFDWIVSDGGNLYVLPYVNHIISIPEDDSKYRNTSENIPFYQMVVHGYIPCSGNSLNLQHDIALQKLQWIEYGLMPSFELTYDSPILLRNTEHNFLFSSRFELWKDEVVSISKEFNSKLKDIWSSPIVFHEKISSEHIRVIYENGFEIHINYGNSIINFDEITIPPKDYIIYDNQREES